MRLARKMTVSEVPIMMKNQMFGWKQPGLLDENGMYIIILDRRKK